MEKVRSFTDLVAWREGHSLVLSIYSLTKCFPREEIYCLVTQIRRASVSITSNIAEGFSRGTRRDKVQFYRVALGSLTEVQDQLSIARDLKYLTNAEFQVVADKSVLVSKLIIGLIKSAESV